MADSYTAPPVAQPTGTPPVTQPTSAPPDTQPTSAPPVTQPTGTAPQPTTTTRSKVSSNEDVLLYFVALFVPPIPVLLKRGPGAQFCINILLWIFGWIPGVIHSWYIISKSERAV